PLPLAHPDEDPHAVVARDQVDLAEARAVVSRDDFQPPPLEEARGARLRIAAACLRGRARAAGPRRRHGERIGITRPPSTSEGVIVRANALPASSVILPVTPSSDARRSARISCSARRKASIPKA